MQKLNSGNLFTEKGTVNIQKKKQTNNTKQKREKLKSIMFSQMLISSPHSPPPPSQKKKKEKKERAFHCKQILGKANKIFPLCHKKVRKIHFQGFSGEGYIFLTESLDIDIN